VVLEELLRVGARGSSPKRLTRGQCLALRGGAVVKNYKADTGRDHQPF